MMLALLGRHGRPRSQFEGSFAGVAQRHDPSRMKARPDPLGRLRRSHRLLEALRIQHGLIVGWAVIACGRVHLPDYRGAPGNPGWTELIADHAAEAIDMFSSFS